MLEPNLPEQLNATQVFVDVHIEEGRGDKTALLCEGEAVTYRELYEGVNRFGNAIRGLGIRMEERVAILQPDTPGFVYAFFGAMKTGAVAIPMNTLLKPDDYEYLLNDSRARALVVHSSLLKDIESVRGELKYLEHVITSDTKVDDHLFLGDLMADASPALDPADTSKDDAAFWLYSSGTTGFPKGAIHLHHDMIVEADLYARNVLGIQESDVCFSVAKLFFAYGLGNGLYFALRVGGTNVLLPGRPMPDTCYDLIDTYEPTIFYSVPTSYAALLHEAEKSGRDSLGKVRMCVSAGEPLPKPIFEAWKERFGVEILDGIGSTEILHIFISNRPGQARPGSTGQIVPGYEAKIVDDDGMELSDGQVGTLWIKGDSIAAGYWNKHEQTKQAFHGEWINTHDKFSRDDDGFFWYQGRTDDMMKVSGYAVWPTDVEAILKEHPAVLESGVAGVPDSERLVKLWAYIVLKDGLDPSPELAKELQNFVKTATAPYKYPRFIVFVDDLPKTATGKIQRFKLREMAMQEQGSK
ncbi:MAG: benzoate-CoA ligase family protein [Planctomycetes bacterium]|nr:benzoate-CoA ligase family protein [Planctomycetota bacterium]